DLLPLQVTDLRGSQAVPIGDQDHGCVAMPVATMLSGAVDELVDLALGEVAPLDCQVYDGWCAFLRSRFHADKPCLRARYCLAYTPFLHSRKPAACTVIAMQDGGTGAGTQHGGAGREANLIFVLPPNVYVAPP